MGFKTIVWQHSEYFLPVFARGCNCLFVILVGHRVVSVLAVPVAVTKKLNEVLIYVCWCAVSRMVAQVNVNKLEVTVFSKTNGLICLSVDLFPCCDCTVV